MAPPPRDSEEAVSPIIGVILMVAITVVVAAVVMVMVSGFGKDTGEAHILQMYRDQNSGTLTITRASEGLLRADLEVKVSTGVRVGYNAPAEGGTSFAAGVYGPVDSELLPVAGGDILEFCSEGAVGAEVQIAFRHISAPTALLYTSSFTYLRTCA